MRLVIFGASGGVGRALAHFARERGHTVTAVVRASTTFAPPAGVEVLTGDVLEPGVIARAVVGQDSVASCLGFRRQNPKNPWSAHTSPPGFTSSTAQLLVSGMQQAGVRRLVAVSAAGVAESRPLMNPLLCFFIEHSTIGVAYEDLALMEATYRASGLDWLAVRPVTLTDGPRTDRVRVIEGYPLSASISRADVAAWMLSKLEGGSLEPRTPTIAAA